MKRTLPRLTLFISVTLLAFTTIAQSKRANIWYFGKNAGLDFNTNPPTALTDGQINTIESAGATISDTSGKLLFYTDGLTVWNKQHKVMQNGTGLNGHQSSSQSALIVPQPENDSTYYIFTTDALAYGNGFEYSVVNINKDSGRGEIVSKNSLLQTPVCEKLVATIHENGQDIWIVTHEFFSNSFYSYLLTKNGLTKCPVISKSGSVHGKYDSFGQWIRPDAQGYMKFSPSGEKIAVTLYDFYVEIFDFNKLTGAIAATKVKKLNSILLPYGLEFSSDNKKLFVTDRGKNLFVYDISLTGDTSINNSRRTIYNFNNYIIQSIQRTSDNKIAISFVDSSFIKFIPDTLFNPIQFNTDSDIVWLSGGQTSYGLPNFISNYFNNQEAPFYYTISQDSVMAFPVSTLVKKWLFYKGTTLIDSSTKQQPSFPLGIDRNYSLLLITNMGDSFTRSLVALNHIVKDDTIAVCNKDSFILLADSDFYCVYWNDTLSGSTLKIYSSGIYTVQGTDGYGNVAKDSIVVFFDKIPKTYLGTDTILCNATGMTLTATTPASKKLWNIGDTSTTINVTTTGTYWLRESNNLCSAVDSIDVTFSSVAKPTIVRGHDTLFAPSANKYVWYLNNQPIIGATDSFYVVKQKGIYQVQIANQEGCTAISDTVNFNIFTSIKNTSNAFFEVYPNPANESIYIVSEGLGEVVLYDITGKKILQKTLAKNNEELDISDLSQGLYLLNYSYSTGTSIQIKLIKYK